MRLNQNIKLIIILSMTLLTGISCSSRKNKIDSKDLIPPKQLTDIIADMYLTDGLMTMPQIHERYQSKDSLSAYRDVVEKHGYSMDALTKTLKYYFVKRPKQLVKIYDRALARLTEMEAKLEVESNAIQAKEANVWTGKTSYSGSDSTAFDLTVKIQGTYMLSFTATLFPGDESLHPSPFAYTCHPDSAYTGKRHSIRTFEYIKDGRPHEYFYNIVVKNNLTRIRGNLFDAGICTENTVRNMAIENVKMTSVGGV